MKIKLSITTIKRKQEHDLDLRTKIAKWMANASFYRLKLRTIHLVIDYWCSGQLLI
jgi:hypothetical protein